MASTTFVANVTRIVRAWLQDVNDSTYGPTAPTTTLRGQLADPTSASNGDAMVAVQSALANTKASTQHEVNERVRNVFDWLTPAEKAAVLTPTLLDMTTNLQLAIDSGCSLVFPEGVYFATKLTFNKVGKTYWGNNSQFVGVDTAPQRGVIDYQGSSCRFYAFNIVGGWKSNYVAAVWWHSASAGAAAQSTTWYGVSIDNVLVGWLFGDLISGDPLLALTGVSYQAPVDAAQSENYVYGCIMRGVEQGIYSNQPNGFIKFVGGKIFSSKSEWDTGSPGVYSFTRSCPINVLQGVVGVYGDVGKTDTQLGSGIKVADTGGLDVSGDLEIGCQILTLTGGVTHIHDIGGAFWPNAATDWANLSGTSGVLTIENVVIGKAAGAAAAATSLVNFAGTGWDVALTNVRAENQLCWFCTGSTAAAPNRWSDNSLNFFNCAAPLAGGATTPNSFPRINSSTYNQLELRGTDVNGNDIATWFKRDTAGVGAIALDADVPSGSGYPNSIMVTPAVTTGGSEVTNMDLTSLATVKATAVKCRPGDTFILSGWFRMTTSGTAQVDVTYANAAGAASASGVLANQADLLTDAWKYIESMFLVPAGAAYLGVGIRGTSGTVCRMVGLKLSKLV